MPREIELSMDEEVYELLLAVAAVRGLTVESLVKELIVEHCAIVIGTFAGVSA